MNTFSRSCAYFQSPIQLQLYLHYLAHLHQLSISWCIIALFTSSFLIFSFPLCIFHILLTYNHYFTTTHVPYIIIPNQFFKALSLTFYKLHPLSKALSWTGLTHPWFSKRRPFCTKAIVLPLIFNLLLRSPFTFPLILCTYFLLFYSGLYICSSLPSILSPFQKDSLSPKLFLLSTMFL